MRNETLLTLNTRSGVKKSKHTNYSSYWLDNDDNYDFKITAEDIINPERIVKLASVRRAVANFVRILTNDSNINVVFSSGKNSYTDGKEVVIAAEEDPKHFDSMVGLALHEGAHCLLSDFNMLQNLITQGNHWHAFVSFSPEIRTIVSGDNDPSSRITTFQQLLGNIMNVIEDRRIDSYVYQNAGGYRPYYDALYTKYFFNAEVTKSLKNDPSWREPKVENYINWMINIFHPNFDSNALPGLKDIVKLIDLKNIRRFDITEKMPINFDNWPMSDESASHMIGSITHTKRLVQYDKLPLLWRVANDILYVILQHVAKVEMGESNPSGTDNQKTISINIDGITFDVDVNENKLENLDINVPVFTPVPAKKFNSDKAKKAMDNIKKIMSGKNTRKKLKKRDKQDVEQLESAQAKIVEAGDKLIGKFPCLVTRKLTKQIMLSDWFPFARTTVRGGGRVLASHQLTEQAVVKGVRMGQVLVNRLQVRNDPLMTHFTRQTHGKIDRRVLAQLGMDIESVFKRTTVDNYKPVMLHLSLDASGSMGGDKWTRVMTVATALAYVSSKIKNIETVITLRGDSTIPIVCVVYDSRKDNFQKARQLFPSLQNSGSTPEGLCFKATLDMITECTTEYDTYFINFSDGEPGTTVYRNGQYTNYSGTSAAEHTRRQVQAMREAGVKIMSYFISWDGLRKSSYDSNPSLKVFRSMYGEDAVSVDVNNVTEVLRTLNRLLLKKGT